INNEVGRDIDVAARTPARSSASGSLKLRDHGPGAALTSVAVRLVLRAAQWTRSEEEVVTTISWTIELTARDVQRLLDALEHVPPTSSTTRRTSSALSRSCAPVPGASAIERAR
ncbi:MAG: hypothetical protein J2P17_03980, partial [Mycobacterium sp.]|nr:hypothetical protein [Mycobacterium sp.]